MGRTENLRRQITIQVVDIESLIPADYYLRRIDAAIDFSFIRDRVAHLYSHTGRPSIDPEVAFRLITLSYLLGISENRLFTELPLHAGYLWFCGLDFNSPLPDRTTLVRARKLWRNHGLFEVIMREIVRQYVEAGLVKGDILAADGTIIKARAAIKSLEAFTPQPIDKYLEELKKQDEKELEAITKSEDESEPPGGGDPPVRGDGQSDNKPEDQTLQDVKPSREFSGRKAGDPDLHGEKFSNATHRSATDPEARLFRKGPGKEAKLGYLAHNLLDVRSCVVIDAMATQPNGALERAAALEMLKKATLLLPPLSPEKGKRSFLGDGNYTAGDFLAEVIALGYQPLVPMGNVRLEPLPTWKRRTYNLSNYIKRKERIRIARAKNLARTLKQSREYRRTYRYRVRIERAFAEAKEHHGLDRARSYGLAAVDEQVKMTAVVQNMKHLANWIWRRKKRAAKVMEITRTAVTALQERMVPLQQFLFYCVFACW
ncbi:transposase [Moorella sulfitireducens]|uniref:transposase n=1 Tax=Neomoorella sulfitireducens TaxID=2972948 RepID=UPI0021AC3A1C|nr:transposase [Moorella sulfitireducens]